MVYPNTFVRKNNICLDYIHIIFRIYYLSDHKWDKISLALLASLCLTPRHGRLLFKPLLLLQGWTSRVRGSSTTVSQNPVWKTDRRTHRLSFDNDLAFYLLFFKNWLALKHEKIQSQTPSPNSNSILASQVANRTVINDRCTEEEVLASYLPTLPMFPGDSSFSSPFPCFIPGSQFSRISLDLWQIFTLFFLFVISTCFWNCTACISPTVSTPDDNRATPTVSFPAEESSLCSRHSTVWAHV